MIFDPPANICAGGRLVGEGREREGGEEGIERGETGGGGREGREAGEEPLIRPCLCRVVDRAELLVALPGQFTSRDRPRQGSG